MVGQRRIKLVNEVMKKARDNKRNTGELLMFLTLTTDRGLTKFHKEYLAIEFKK